jgi:hypothetical protein
MEDCECKESDCDFTCPQDEDGNFHFDYDTCECWCKLDECPPGSYLDEEMCMCVNWDCDECPAGYTYGDADTCECVPINDDCLDLECEDGEIADYEECECRGEDECEPKDCPG